MGERLEVGRAKSQGNGFCLGEVGVTVCFVDKRDHRDTPLDHRLSQRGTSLTENTLHWHPNGKVTTATRDTVWALVYALR